MALTTATTTLHLHIQPSQYLLYSDRIGSHYLCIPGELWLMAYKYGELLLTTGLPAVPVLLSQASPYKQFDLWI
jgi:hypothetical protein